ncbi:glycosyltransferase family 2 protein [Phytohabitans sp. ZYX-F-186]|uniref:Glycosyltransferase family 2 protein n=1 Tax=Phytohabitans maris TaxID=3071409 RepID=A0ABU0ZFL7_9ACTN|nr:glycosyltransferase family 2 protein [Phytohabitans sp. ZYX-F-186]MDQ7905783.1 glycosyltransferase family 2 protein [Phytohabitans sp. ZYX-F-186]
MNTYMAPVSVVIPTHDERRWARLVATVRSVREQSPAPAKVVVAVDHNPELLARVRRELPGVTAVGNEHARGVSGTRNTGVAHTGTPVVALLDDDTVAHPGWLAGLVRPFADPRVVGTGGAIMPGWQRRPDWFPDALLWAVGASETGVSPIPATVRNVWSGSMAVRREVFTAVGGFRVGFGKVGGRSRPEDTELCLRMSRHTGGHWVHVPLARVDHSIPDGTVSLRYLLRRCYHEGRGKVEMSRLLGGRDSLSSEREYLRRTVPLAVGRDLAGAVRGTERHGLARAGTVVAGLAAAAAGGAVEWLSSSGTRTRRTP